MADSQAQGGQQQQPMMAQPQAPMMGPQPTMMGPQPTMMGPQPTMMIVQPQESCRNSSRVVAWIDIVLGVLSLLFCGLIMWGGVSGLNSAYVHPLVYVGMAFAGIGLVIHVVEICIAAGLLTATNINTPPFEGMTKAKCWRNYQIFLIIFSLFTGCVTIGGGENVSGGYYVVSFLIHCLFIYIVHKFIQELGVGGGAPMMMGQGNPMPYAMQQHPSQYQQQPQYQQHPSQYQQQPQNQNQQQS